MGASTTGEIHDNGVIQTSVIDVDVIRDLSCIKKSINAFLYPNLMYQSHPCTHHRQCTCVEVLSFGIPGTGRTQRRIRITINLHVPFHPAATMLQSAPEDESQHTTNTATNFKQEEDITNDGAVVDTPSTATLFVILPLNEICSTCYKCAR